MTMNLKSAMVGGTESASNNTIHDSPQDMVDTLMKFILNNNAANPPLTQHIHLSNTTTQTFITPAPLAPAAPP
jgi:hypothetical protein